MAPDEANTILNRERLREIVEGTAVETGEAFFGELVKHLARAIGTKCVWVTEWLERTGRLRALSFWVGDGFFGDFEYDIADTPCERVVQERRLVHLPDRVLELYAGDPSLKPLGAVSYLGVPLVDTDGALLGHLAALHDQPMPENPEVTAIFNIFAGRAAAELRRLRRERDLKERERKLSRLIDSAMDAIVELDGAFRVTNMNSAAERVFGCVAADVGGVPFDDFVTRESRGKLACLTEELDRGSEGRQSIWIPDGIDGTRADGKAFPAEATLSRYELGGRSHYTLILRNIDDRLESEKRIRRLMNETAYLREEIDALHGFDDIIGQSKPLLGVLADVERVAGAETTVLITGETGTGKELIARAIHRRSPRAAGPLITVNCAAIAEQLQESEFFGHEKGAFTGATQRRDGRFKLADGGTIFLDEVGEMPLDLQGKLLRVLQEGEFDPVGGSRTVRVDVRVIAATNRDLEEMTRAGAFRADLFYRLNVFPLTVPPLRERGEDIVLMAEAFASKFARRSGRSIAPLGQGCKARLLSYSWPGNVRELQNVIERAIITSVDGRTLNLDRALPERPEPDTRRSAAPAASPVPADDRVLTATELKDFERGNLLRALDASGWKLSGEGGAAQRLGMNPNTLASRMKALGVRRRPDHRKS